MLAIFLRPSSLDSKLVPALYRKYHVWVAMPCALRSPSGYQSQLLRQLLIVIDQGPVARKPAF